MILSRRALMITFLKRKALMKAIVKEVNGNLDHLNQILSTQITRSLRTRVTQVHHLHLYHLLINHLPSTPLKNTLLLIVKILSLYFMIIFTLSSLSLIHHLS
jgi:hypothetical protein